MLDIFMFWIMKVQVVTFIPKTCSLPPQKIHPLVPYTLKTKSFPRISFTAAFILKFALKNRRLPIEVSFFPISNLFCDTRHCEME